MPVSSLPPSLPPLPPQKPLHHLSLLLPTPPCLSRVCPSPRASGRNLGWWRARSAPLISSFLIGQTLPEPRGSWRVPRPCPCLNPRRARPPSPVPAPAFSLSFRLVPIPALTPLKIYPCADGGGVAAAPGASRSPGEQERPPSAHPTSADLWRGQLGPVHSAGALMQPPGPCPRLLGAPGPHQKGRDAIPSFLPSHLPFPLPPDKAPRGPGSCGIPLRR